ncbi:rhodanese-like domain-containing protein [Alphaproteobacteria bacterium]|nr:rhodanese-like domain-containing protein [Alphaproteobacteria bacterium]
MRTKITADKVKLWLADNKEIAFIDLREISQHSDGHPFFSISIPYSIFELKLGELVPNKKTRLILIDNNNEISSYASDKAVSLGYLNIYVVEGGISGWTREGFSLFDGINVPSKSFGELIEKEYHTPSITAKELHQKQSKNENYVVIDGRPFDEYTKMSIPKSICCPNAELALRVPFYVNDNNTEIIINCAGRTRSIIGAQTLIEFGIKNTVKALENGTQGWFLSDLSLDNNKDKMLDILPNDLEIKKLQEKALNLIDKNNIKVIEISQAQQLIDDTNTSTFVFNVTNTLGEKTVNEIPNVPGGQLVQATDKYIGVWNSNVILIDDGDLIRAGSTAMWLKKMNFNVYVLKNGILKASKLKLIQRHYHKKETLDTLNINDLITIKNCIFFDIRPSKDYLNVRLKNSLWLNRSEVFKNNIYENDNIIIITDDLKKAFLIIKDIQDQNKNCRIQVYKWSKYDLVKQPDLFDRSIKKMDREKRIDFNFHTYMRHAGNKKHAKQYLKWEIDLVKKMDQEEIDFFKIF